MTEPFISMKVQGLEAVKKQLEKLSDKARRKVARKALKESSDIIVRQAILNCPIDTGKLRNSIKAKVTVGTVNEKAVVSAGDADAWYAHLVEYGFNHTGHGKNRKLRKITSRGFVDGKSFMRNAIESRFEDMMDIFEETLAEVVLEEMGKVEKAEGENL